MKHQPTRQELKAWTALCQEASQGPRFTPAYLNELARKRDQFLANLAK